MQLFLSRTTHDELPKNIFGCASPNMLATRTPAFLKTESFESQSPDDLEYILDVASCSAHVQHMSVRKQWELCLLREPKMYNPFKKNLEKMSIWFIIKAT